MHYNMPLSQAYPLAAGLTQAQAQKRAKTLLKELHDRMEASKSKRDSTSPLDFPPDMPNLFHLQHLKLQNVEPVYSDGQVHPAKPKLVEYWKATFYHRLPVGKGADGKTIYATTAGQYLSFTFKNIIHSLDALLLPIYPATARALQLPHGALWDATTAVTYRLLGNMFLPMLRTTEGEVALCEGAVGGSEIQNIDFKPFEDYYAKVINSKKEVHYYITIVYNKKDKDVNKYINNLKHIWPNSIIIGGWTLFFNIERKTIEYEYIERSPDEIKSIIAEQKDYTLIDNENGLMEMKKLYPYATLLMYNRYKQQGDDSFTTPYYMSIAVKAWNLDEEQKPYEAYAHEIGHVLFNDYYDIEADDFNLDLRTLPSHLSITKIREMYFPKLSIENQGMGTPKCAFNITQVSHYDLMVSFMQDNNALPISKDGVIEPVIWKPNDTNNISSVNWDENKNPNDFGYSNIPMMSYGKPNQHRDIWIFEYRELLKSTLGLVDLFLKKYSNSSRKTYENEIETYYIKRKSRIVFWTRKK